MRIVAQLQPGTFADYGDRLPDNERAAAEHDLAGAGNRLQHPRSERVSIDRAEDRLFGDRQRLALDEGGRLPRVGHEPLEKLVGIEGQSGGLAG